MTCQPAGAIFSLNLTFKGSFKLPLNVRLTRERLTSVEVQMGEVTKRHSASISILEARRPCSCLQGCLGPLSHPPQEGRTPFRRPRRLAPDPFSSDPDDRESHLRCGLIGTNSERTTTMNIHIVSILYTPATDR